MCFRDNSQRPYEHYPPPRQHDSQWQYHNQEKYDPREATKAHKRARRRRGLVASVAAASSGGAAGAAAGGGGC